MNALDFDSPTEGGRFFSIGKKLLMLSLRRDCNTGQEYLSDKALGAKSYRVLYCTILSQQFSTLRYIIRHLSSCTAPIDFGRKILMYYYCAILLQHNGVVQEDKCPIMGHSIKDQLSTTTLYLELHCVVTALCITVP